MRNVQVSALTLWLLPLGAGAAETIEAVGAEKCGGALKAYTVDYLAGESGPVEARVKVMVGGLEEIKRGTTGLSLDGKPCSDARCAFRATKGQSYKLTATAQTADNLCISVTRP
jgi:hypothetical protein